MVGMDQCEGGLSDGTDQEVHSGKQEIPRNSQESDEIPRIGSEIRDRSVHEEVGDEGSSEEDRSSEEDGPGEENRPSEEDRFSEEGAGEESPEQASPRAEQGEHGSEQEAARQEDRRAAPSDKRRQRNDLEAEQTDLGSRGNPALGGRPGRAAGSRQGHWRRR